MNILTHPRVKELLLKGRMDDSDRNRGNLLYGLTDLIQEHITPDSIVIEIGSFRGISSELFSLFCKEIHCIDFWYGGADYYGIDKTQLLESAEIEFDKLVKRYNNIKKHKGFSIDLVNSFEDNFCDLIYIDGDHSEFDFRQDMDNWVSKVKPNGIIAGHDFYWITPYITDYTNYDSITVYEDGSWAYKKIN
jgi:predicted O-methyltransferase YrrM